MAVCPSPATAFDTYYVRLDGGSAAQCTGTVDAPYPGSGNAQPCAWNHPFQALPPEGTPRIAGGDTLIIAAGSYRMGLGAPAADACDQSYSWDCHMLPLPSGPDVNHPTRLLGSGWDGGCTDPPELWGTERTSFVLDLTGSSHIELACLDITDHSGCIEDHNFDDVPCGGCTVRCERDTPPFGDWAQVGVHAEDSSDARLADLRVHGLAAIGIHAGRLSDWTVERVRITGNGLAGWDGDLWDGGGDSNSGNMVFRFLEVAWNGCAEDPATGSIDLDSCWGQQTGGYGDGFATGYSAGNWVFEDAHIHHNTSDGLDLLYLRDASLVTIRRLRANGNAGNPAKTAGAMIMTNSVLVADCSAFSSLPLFQGVGLGDNCRAGGNTLAVDLHRGNSVTVMNSTLTGEGDCMVEAGCNDSMEEDLDPDCDGSESLQLSNVLFSGATDWVQPWELSCLAWYDDSLLPADPVSFTNDLIWQAKNDPCPNPSCVCQEDPLLMNDSLTGFNPHLLAGSPAINAGTSSGAPTDDFDSNPRDPSPDIGACERTDTVFADGFESGGSWRWSAASP